MMMTKWLLLFFACSFGSASDECDASSNEEALMKQIESLRTTLQEKENHINALHQRLSEQMRSEYASTHHASDSPGIMKHKEETKQQLNSLQKCHKEKEVLQMHNQQQAEYEQQYVMCKTAVTELQSDIEQKQKKFSLCSKVSKDCKKDRKEMKNELEGVRKELLECKETMRYTLNKYCWVAMEDKEYVTIGCALCVFVVGVMALIVWMVVSDVLKAQEEDNARNMAELNEQIQDTEDRIEEYKRKMEEKEKEIQELKEQHL